MRNQHTPRSNCQARNILQKLTKAVNTTIESFQKFNLLLLAMVVFLNCETFYEIANFLYAFSIAFTKKYNSDIAGTRMLLDSTELA